MPEIIKCTPEGINKARTLINRERGAYQIIINGYRRQLTKLKEIERKLDAFEKRPQMFRESKEQEIRRQYGPWINGKKKA